MKKRRLILSVGLLVFFFGALAPQFAQNVPSTTQEHDDDRSAALGLLRTINTAEVVEFSSYHTYASWQTLSAHQSKYINRCTQENGIHLGIAPEVLPMWNLRLNVSADGRAYDVRLQDLADKQRGFVAFSDESGIIWQGQWIH
jgi:hypothetical protein